MNRRILEALNKLDHEPRDEAGDDIAGARGSMAGDGLSRVHVEVLEFCLERLKLK